MKKVSLLIICLLLFLTLVSCSYFNDDDINEGTNDNVEYTDTVDVIVIAGQSNMEGHSHNNMLLQKTSGDIQEFYRNGFPNTKIMYHCNRGTNRNYSFESVKIGQGYGGSQFGPEVGIAEELYLRGREEPVYIIKYAVGGTSLYGDWNVKIKTSLYHKMIYYTTNILKEFEEKELKPIIRGFFWMQGESDACNTTFKNIYYKNLENLVTSFRNEFESYYGIPNNGIAFVDAGISDCKAWLFYKEINQIKQQFADSDPEKNYYFDTMEAGLEYDKDNDDFYHFDATSEIKLGRLFISTLIDNGWL